MVDDGLLDEWTGVLSSKTIGKKWKLK
jgi:hypothetical protein